MTSHTLKGICRRHLVFWKLEVNIFKIRIFHCRAWRRWGAFVGADGQAAVPVLLPDLLWDPELPGETLRGGAAATRGGICFAQGRVRNTEKYVFFFVFFLISSINWKVTIEVTRSFSVKSTEVCSSVSLLLFTSGKIALERERLEAERRERERRFELESQERQVILDLLKEKVLKGWPSRARTPAFSGRTIRIAAWSVALNNTAHRSNKREPRSEWWVTLVIQSSEPRDEGRAVCSLQGPVCKKGGKFAITTNKRKQNSDIKW